MTWTSIYLVCFLLGFSLSAISWLLGALHLHLPHVFHGGLHAHGHAHGGHAGHAGLRGTHTVAPSSIRAWFQSPGASRWSSSSARL